MQYRFAFRSSFAGVVDYDAFDGRNPIGRVSVTVSPLSDYWRAMSRNPAAEDSALHILRWHNAPSYGEPAPMAMVEAFNAWKSAEYDAAKVECARRWPDDWQTYFPEPATPVCAGRLNSAAGLWERLPELAIAA